MVHDMLLRGLAPAPTATTRRQLALPLRPRADDGAEVAASALPTRPPPNCACRFVVSNTLNACASRSTFRRRRSAAPCSTRMSTRLMRELSICDPRRSARGRSRAIGVHRARDQVAAAGVARRARHESVLKVSRSGRGRRSRSTAAGSRGPQHADVTSYGSSTDPLATMACRRSPLDGPQSRLRLKASR